MEPFLYFQAISALVSTFTKEPPANVLKSTSQLAKFLDNKPFYTSCVDYVKNTPKFVPNAVEFMKNLIALTQEYNEFPKMKKFAHEIDEIVKVRSDNERVQIKDNDGAVSITSTEPLYSDDLDRAQVTKCSDPTCTLDHSQMPVVLASPCHPGAPLYLTYKDKVLVTHCCVCRREAFAIHVESR